MLSASNGTWSGSSPINYRYQWRLCDSLGTGCTDITGQTAQTYVLTAADVGNTLRVWVTAKNEAGSSLSVSAPTAKVSAAASTTTTATTTTPPTTTGTVVTVTAGVPGTYTFRLSTAAQPKVVSDIPKTELTVPTGNVTFNVSDSPGAIDSHTFEVCTTALPGPVSTLAAIQALPNSCTGTTVPPSPSVLSPGASATVTIDFTSPGTYEYLSTVGGAATGDAFAGMKGVLNVT